MDNQLECSILRSPGGNFKFCEENDHDGVEHLEVIKVQIYKRVRRKAMQRKFDSAQDIAEDFLLAKFEKEAEGFPIINVNNLARIANRKRAKARPTHPTDLFLKLILTMFLQIF